MAAPATFGVNVTVNVADWPVGIVKGKVIPESENSPLPDDAEEMVTAEDVAVTLAPSEELDPTATVPKLRDAGEMESCPAAVPVPESEMVKFESEESETMVRLPLADPELAGENTVVKVTL